jgi:hypothetical protein
VSPRRVTTSADVCARRRCPARDRSKEI